MSIATTGSTNGLLVGQATLSTTASKIVDGRSRYRVIVKNMEAAGGIVVYVGHNDTVGPTTGMPLGGGESIALYTTADIWAEAASGTPKVAYAMEQQI